MVCQSKASRHQAVSNIDSCVTLFSIRGSRQDGKNKKEKGTWATSFGESWAERDFEDLAVAANAAADAGDEEAEEVGVHPQ